MMQPALVSIVATTTWAAGPRIWLAVGTAALVMVATRSAAMHQLPFPIGPRVIHRMIGAAILALVIMVATETGASNRIKLAVEGVPKQG